MLVHHELLQAIIAQPDDDALRLIYADWLEEQGAAERAEFIRLQVRFPHETPAHRTQQDAHARMNTLLYRHGPSWTAELPPLPQGLYWSGWQRGFVEEIVVEEGDPAAVPEAVFALTPFRQLCWRLTQQDRPAPRFSGTVLLQRTRTMRVVRASHRYPIEPHDDALVRNLCQWPECAHFMGLELFSLDISANACTLVADAAWPALRALRWFCTSSHVLSAEALLAAPWIAQLHKFELRRFNVHGLLERFGLHASAKRLRTLSFRSAQLDNSDAVALAATGLLGRLRSLNLEQNSISVQGIRAILKQLAPETILEMNGNPLDEAGFIALVESPQLAQMQYVPNINGAIHDAGAIALAQSPYATNLQTVTFFHNGAIGERGLAALLHSPNLRQIVIVNLDNNFVGALPRIDHPQLHGLHLKRNQLDEQSLAALADSTLPKLNRLGLENNALGPKAMAILANAKGLPALQTLLLSHNPLGDAGAIALAQGTELKALEELRVQDCGLTVRTLHAWRNTRLLRQLKTLRLRSDSNTIDDHDLYAFSEYALALGCDVDEWSKRPRLRSVCRPTPGEPLAAEDRRALATWASLSDFQEYASACWLKVVSFDELMGSLDAAERGILNAYRTAPTPTHAQRLAVVQLFLNEWMTGTVPESVFGGWDLPDTGFTRRTRGEMLDVVDGMINACTERLQRHFRGLRPDIHEATEPARVQVVTDEIELESLPIEQLRQWFVHDLFDRRTVAYYTYTDQQRVIALDEQMIGMIWCD